MPEFVPAPIPSLPTTNLGPRHLTECQEQCLITLGKIQPRYCAPMPRYQAHCCQARVNARQRFKQQTMKVMKLLYDLGGNYGRNLHCAVKFTPQATPRVVVGGKYACETGEIVAAVMAVFPLCCKQKAGVVRPESQRLQGQRKPISLLNVVVNIHEEGSCSPVPPIAGPGIWERHAAVVPTFASSAIVGQKVNLTQGVGVGVLRVVVSRKVLVRVRHKLWNEGQDTEMGSVNRGIAGDAKFVSWALAEMAKIDLSQEAKTAHGWGRNTVENLPGMIEASHLECNFFAAEWPEADSRQWSSSTESC
ncbi:hypothetical protein B0H16DRAFT_1472839 [Mycena metata]|uniref:Uncharacterized protein n=1 Tax=Mycena metata TaxID=1033252 RepID=A0AAD7MJW8_9AGAR|nr:hypothetical protein B0H16DRAFT_1474193 [Mycena metata]KAJ7723585.1 hypothetical protein B0H16DRAFT_1472839 [Mycena metata]